MGLFSQQNWGKVMLKYPNSILIHEEVKSFQDIIMILNEFDKASIA